MTSSDPHPPRAPLHLGNWLKNAARSFRLLLTVALFAGVILYNGVQAFDYVRLLAVGESTTGTVLRKDSRSGNGSTRYGVEYSFKVGEKAYTRSVVVKKKHHDQLVSKAPLPVVYLASDPQTNNYRENLWSGLISRLVTLAIFGTVAGVALAIVLLATAKRSTEPATTEPPLS